MKNEAQGIIRELDRNLAASPGQDYPDIHAVLLRGDRRLAKRSRPDVVLVGRLANYLMYTIFTEHLRLTATQNLLVSQLMAIGRRADGQQFGCRAYLDQSQF